MIYDDYMLCKVTLGVLKGASKLNVLLLHFLDFACNSDSRTPGQRAIEKAE